MNKKQIVRLTESDLHRIVKESVIKLLNEVGNSEDGQRAVGKTKDTKTNTSQR